MVTDRKLSFFSPTWKHQRSQTRSDQAVTVRHCPKPLVRALFWATIGSAGAVSIAPMHAQAATAAAESRYDFDIPAGTLDQALRRFGQQSSATIAVNADLTHEVNSPGLHGRYTRGQALQQLLLGTPLEAVHDASGEYTLKRSPEPQGQSLLSKVTRPSAPVSTLSSVVVVGTAAQELKQAPGVSTITRQDIEKRPPVNDLSDIIRTQPGVNLTGNSTSGQRGNNRQIDIRGMGPENTLILIDGKPVTSRDSVRYGWAGERDTRGDTNWVPAEEVERIEVTRGPAAARYGSGAMGGVVNIITKPAADAWHGSMTTYLNQPQHSVDGNTKRGTFDLSGPLSDRFSIRLYGNMNKTNADAYDINKGHTTPRTGIQAGTYPAGREGVRNRDVSGRLTWKLAANQTIDFDASYSRQGNIYAGDTQNTNNFTTTTTGALATTSARVQKYLGAETNIMKRENYAATYNGKFDFGSVMAYMQYTDTHNTRLQEGLSGGVAGLFSSDDFTTSVLHDYTAHAETNIPMQTAGFNHVLTVGTEFTYSSLTDPDGVTQTTTTGGTVGSLTSDGRNDKISDHIASVFVEDNLALTKTTMVTPGVRFDDHSITGPNWSPSLNLSQKITHDWTVKTGIARAYKAPNLYQLNPNYLLYSSGNGCWETSTPCYLQGNSNLKAETSINKEIGLEYSHAGVVAGVTFFRNDYHNKVDAGLSPIGTAFGGNGAHIYQWTNVPKALVQGWEGTFNVPLTKQLYLSNNFTYMITSKNKETGEQLSIIPKYTLNSTLDWTATDKLSLQASLTWFGKQVPKKYDYQGNRVTGYAAEQRAPYALVGLGANYKINKNLRMGIGVSNLFDKRLYREGNASGTTNGTTIISGAGANTYNEPGRAFWASMTASF